MKKNPQKNYDWYKDYGIMKKDSSFLRKGQVGDWKNYFSEEQQRRFDERTEREFAGLGLKFEDSVSERSLNAEEASLAAGRARVKFKSQWLGSQDALFAKYDGLREEYERVCTDLAQQMNELEKSGVAPVAPDGKVLNVSLLHMVCDSLLDVVRLFVFAQVGGNCSYLLEVAGHKFVIVSKSGKAPHRVMDIYEDFAIIDAFDFESWSCQYFASSADVLPTSDAPLHCAVLLQTPRTMNWSQHPKLVLHGHAFETVESATRCDYPISTEETLFSTPEDTEALVTLMSKHAFPDHHVFVRKGHGFVLLASSLEQARKVFETNMKPKL